MDDYVVICTGDANSTPPALFDEETITKQPLRIDSTKGNRLEPESRINFGKVYAVEYNVKIMEIEMLVAEHMHLLRWRRNGICLDVESPPKVNFHTGSSCSCGTLSHA